jgi:hypothetical protein
MPTMTSSRSTSAVVACLSIAAVAAACAAGNDSSTNPSPAGPALSGSPDSGSFAFAGDAGVDASPLLAACDPSNPSSCPTGFTCYGLHTSTTWWVDLYGRCTFACTSQTYALCDGFDGVCGCPVPQGATTASCTAEGEGGAAPTTDASVFVEGGATGGETGLVCVPALKPGTTPGATDGDGGCGTPGCSGGPALDATAPSPSDAGSD